MNKYFHKFLGVSIFPALLVMPAIAEIPSPVEGVLNGVNVSEETGQAAAGRLYNLSTDNSDLTILNSTFSSNTGTVAWATGPSAEAEGNTLTIEGSVFTNNTSANNGTVGVGSYGKQLDMTHSVFSGNNAATGGAIFTSGKNGADISSTMFSNNTASGNGGAIYAASSLSIDGDSSFTGNGATYGGAIISFADNEIDSTTFASNNASATGGAVYAGGSLSLDHVNFLANTAKYGAAAYTADSLSVKNSNFNGNTAESIAGGLYIGGEAEVDSSSFVGNKVTDADGYAGAIANGSKLTVKDSVFSKNDGAEQGGAILNFLYNKKSGETVEDVVLNVKNTEFSENHAVSIGGAVSTFSTANIENATFTKNYTESEGFGDGGAALFVGAESITKIKDSVFENNHSAAAGGAIMTRSADVANNSAAKLDISGTTFKSNIAGTTGGALDTYFYNSQAKEYQMYIADSVFESNSAANGGAIFNHGMVDKGGNQASAYLQNVSFENNMATEKGGAIYNESALELSGTNTFVGNKANGKANDIYNEGDLVITSGVTTIDGGITGEGVLTIAEDAILNIGTASVDQDSIKLNGDMLATLRSGDTAQITAGTFDGNGTLKLTMKEAGTYKVFGNAKFANTIWDESGLTTSSPLYNLAWNGGDVTATRKTIAEIADSNSVSVETASVVSNMTDSSSDKLNDLALKMQEKLAEDTTEAKEAVEHATAAVHPEKESVVQSVATSVQNTVTNLASARMATPMVGRSAGDVKLTSGGVWAQGIFNKSKQNNAFHGYTRGVAAGLDGTINKKWTIGAGYSFAHSDVAGTARDTEIDSSTVFVYGQYKPSEWYLNAVANYTMSDYSEYGNALGTPVSADYDVDAYGVSLATGYEFKSGVTPELGLRYMHVNAEDYVNSTDVKTSLKDNDFLTAVLGTKYAFSIVADKYTTFVPQLNAGLKYDLLSDKNVANITMPGIDTYSLEGERLSRIGGEFGFGLGMKHRSIDFSINYDIDVRKEYTSQTGMLKFRYNF